MISAVTGLFGLVIGSALNVVIHRVPLQQSFVWPSSRCPNCGAQIKAFHNFPVLPYLVLRRNFRNCKVLISPRYPLVEVLTGLLLVLAAYDSGIYLALVSALVLICVLVVLAGTDLEHRLLPNRIVASAAVVGFVLSVVLAPDAWRVYLASALDVAGGLFALALAYPGGMGMGDVKMGGMLEGFLGPFAALTVFCWGARWSACRRGADRVG